MPAKSKAQIRKLASLVERHRMSMSTFQGFVVDVDTEQLPERLHPMKKKTKKNGKGC